MATLALAAVGASVGGALLPTGISIFGTALTGAAIGSQVGALAGSYVDNALFGASGQSRSVAGPRLSDLQVTSSTEGSAIPRLYGRARLGGQIIWATDFEEKAVTTTQSAGAGKGGALGGASVSSTQYRYFANFAVGICEGPVTRLGRVWADAREIDLAGYVHRFYTGSETQEPDSLIVAKEGLEAAPAYRGLCYIVFERLALSEFGNRVPQLTFEVFRSTDEADADIRGVVLIPGSGEFVYSTVPVRQVFGAGASQAVNVFTLQGETDWAVAIDQLEATLPNAKSVSLVVSWFGTDLRAGECSLRPGVETYDKDTQPISWRVAGVNRAAAYKVSNIDGRAAYGGTPSDQTVIGAIRDLNSRGMKVTYNPFILMDVAAGNSLPNPYGGGNQPSYPWRGRITCHPAAGAVGNVDKTAAAAMQIAQFVGAADPSDFVIVDDGVVYSGPDEWSYRRMVLHQAYLAKVAGGVDAFLIGSELCGLTTVRSSVDVFPFVSALEALASDVKSVLGPEVKVLYAADWSEYFGHQPSDGSGDVYFHLDPLWSSDAIDAIGIDVYWPLADWREGRAHLDYVAGYRSTHDLDYLKSNVQGGEGYDWYYASSSDRDAQVRTPITDGGGKPWVFRYKDIRSWWTSAHYNRPGGIESATPTAWVPQSKPFWFMEIGCPAVDRGANQPNVFVDAKSVENALPYYSRGVRDDLMQRRFLQAFRDAFDPEKDGYVAGLNPVSEVTGERMVALDRIHVYCWDARPYPAFPYETKIWSDGDNWPLGHWLNGRLSGGSLGSVVSRVLSDYGFDDYVSSGLNGSVPGFVIDRVMSPRDALQPLELAYFFDSVESDGRIHFRHRGLEGVTATYTTDELVEVKAGDALVTLTRGQETELPASAKVRFIGADADYQQAVAEARRLTGASGRVAQADLPIVLDDSLAGPIAESWLFETWAARERAQFSLPPSALRIEPGDVIALQTDGRERLVRVTDISDHGVREVEALGIDSEVYDRVAMPARSVPSKPFVQIGSPAVAFLDLPVFGAATDAQSGYVAAVQVPWPGSVAIYSSPQEAGYQLKAIAGAPATMGVTLDPLPMGPEGRIDWNASVRVKLTQGSLESLDLITMLSGNNVAAVRSEGDRWEIIQFLNAELVDTQTYLLSGLLRAQGGSDGEMVESVAAGATFVILDAAVTRVPLAFEELGLPYNWRHGPGNRGIGDVSYETSAHTFRGRGFLPLSPVHVRGVRDAAGNLNISWVRRTRVGGDSWEIAEVPLGEDVESYEVDVLSGGEVVRTLSASVPSVVYDASEQSADFDTRPDNVTVEVYQLSALLGRGIGRRAIV